VQIRGVCLVLVAGLVVLISIVINLGSSSAGAVGSWRPVFDEDFPDPSILVDGNSAYAYATQVVF
jgi:hypothetical protein